VWKSRPQVLDNPVEEYKRRREKAKAYQKSRYVPRPPRPKKAPFVMRDYIARYRAIHAGVKIAEMVSISGLYREQNNLCGICHEFMTEKEYTIDHKTPISRGGNHIKDNLHVVHSPCNHRKGTKTMRELND